MKVFLCPNHDILDVHENHLAAGKYFFNIENFTLNDTVKGRIVKRQLSIAYEFRFFTFMVMLVKAQSYLARRAKITDSRMPNYSSPVAVKKKPLEQCSICLLGIRVERCSKKLACGHSFHTKCIKKWSNYNKSCPNCRDLFETLNLRKK